MKDKYLQFIANLINEKRSKEEGYTMSARWRCLDRGIKEECILAAEKMVNEWWRDEELAEKRRSMGDR